MTALYVLLLAVGFPVAFVLVIAWTIFLANLVLFRIPDWWRSRGEEESLRRFNEGVARIMRPRGGGP